MLEECTVICLLVCKSATVMAAKPFLLSHRTTGTVLVINEAMQPSPWNTGGAHLLIFLLASSNYNRRILKSIFIAFIF